MSISLNDAERAYLQRLAARRARPTRRQKARALLALDAGKAVEDVAQDVGICEEDVAGLVSDFAAHGLAGVGLKGDSGHRTGRLGTIEKTPGVCGGAARIGGTRIPVWQLVEARDLGATEAQLLLDFPRLRAADLVAAWEYAESYPDEIAAEIRRNANEVA